MGAAALARNPGAAHEAAQLPGFAGHSTRATRMHCDAPAQPPNLIKSLRVSVALLVRLAGPPLKMCQAAYCSL